MTERINKTNLDQLPASVQRPRYDPEAHKVGIAHISVGNFHRGHQAVYTDDVLALEGGDWRISGISLRSPAIGEQLSPQDCYYTVTTQSEEALERRLIGSIAEVIIAPVDPKIAIDHVANNAIKIVTLTVTEKGYYYDTVNSQLNIDHPDIQRDLHHPKAFFTTPGFLVAACEQRQKLAGDKLTVISCDNLPENGEVIRNAVMTFAEHYDPNVAKWIKENVSFCSSMVDRIVPAVSDDIRTEVCKELGMDDHALIVTEPFKQWVIEDNFVSPRPAWEKVGALIVDDVSTYEKLKLRTLNGSHSALAYAGCLCGHEYIHQAMRDEKLVALVQRMMEDEMEATLSIPANFAIRDYQAEIRQRFANSHIRYGTKQVATDGSQKVLQRLLKPALELIELNKPIDCIVTVLACWLKFLGGKNEKGQSHSIADPLAESLEKIAGDYLASPRQMLQTMYDQTTIFPEKLKNNTDFNRQLVNALETINNKGVKGRLEEIGI